MKLFGKKTKSESAKPAAEADEVKTAVKEPVDKSKVKKSAVTATVNSEPATVKVNSHVRQILLRPIVSEKATMANAANKYFFVVAPEANKSEIKKAIKEIYGVMPQSVNIINRSGKDMVYRGRAGKTSGHKRALVTLKKGDSIKIYEGI